MHLYHIIICLTGIQTQNVAGVTVEWCIRRHGIMRPAPIAWCKVQQSDVQSDHQNIRVNYDTTVYISKEMMQHKNEVAYRISNYVISFNTEHGFMEKKHCKLL